MTNQGKRKRVPNDDQLDGEDKERMTFKSDEITQTFADWGQWDIFSAKYADDNKIVLCCTSSKSVEWQNERLSKRLKAGQPPHRLLPESGPGALRTYERAYDCNLRARPPSKERVAKKPRLTACPFKLRVRIQYEGEWLLKVTSSNHYEHNHSRRCEPTTVVAPVHRDISRRGGDKTPWISSQTASVMLVDKEYKKMKIVRMIPEMLWKNELFLFGGPRVSAQMQICRAEARSSDSCPQVMVGQFSYLDNKLEVVRVEGIDKYWVTSTYLAADTGSKKELNDSWPFEWKAGDSICTVCCTKAYTGTVWGSRDFQALREEDDAGKTLIASCELLESHVSWKSMEQQRTHALTKERSWTKFYRSDDSLHEETRPDSFDTLFHNEANQQLCVLAASERSSTICQRALGVVLHGINEHLGPMTMFFKKWSKEKKKVFEQVVVDASVSGNYPEVNTFMKALERITGQDTVVCTALTQRGGLNVLESLMQEKERHWSVDTIESVLQVYSNCCRCASDEAIVFAVKRKKYLEGRVGGAFMDGVACATSGRKSLCVKLVEHKCLDLLLEAMKTKGESAKSVFKNYWRHAPDEDIVNAFMDDRCIGLCTFKQAVDAAIRERESLCDRLSESGDRINEFWSRKNHRVPVIVINNRRKVGAQTCARQMIDQALPVTRVDVASAVATGVSTVSIAEGVNQAINVTSSMAWSTSENELGGLHHETGDDTCAFDGSDPYEPILTEQYPPSVQEAMMNATAMEIHGETYLPSLYEER